MYYGEHGVVGFVGEGGKSERESERERGRERETSERSRETPVSILGGSRAK